jgi:hypothetical protein
MEPLGRIPNSRVNCMDVNDEPDNLRCLKQESASSPYLSAIGKWIR